MKEFVVPRTCQLAYGGEINVATSTSTKPSPTSGPCVPVVQEISTRLIEYVEKVVGDCEKEKRVTCRVAKSKSNRPKVKVDICEPSSIKKKKQQ